MIEKWLALSVVLALCGCSSSQQVQVSQTRHYAWDGLGRDPDLPVMKHVRTKTEAPRSGNENTDVELAKLRPFSLEWVTKLQAMNAEDDARISKLIVICRGCDLTGRDVSRISQSPAPLQRTTEAAR